VLVLLRRVLVPPRTELMAAPRALVLRPGVAMLLPDEGVSLLSRAAAMLPDVAVLLSRAAAMLPDVAVLLPCAAAMLLGAAVLLPCGRAWLRLAPAKSHAPPARLSLPAPPAPQDRVPKSPGCLRRAQLRFHPCRHRQ